MTENNPVFSLHYQAQCISIILCINEVFVVVTFFFLQPCSLCFHHPRDSGTEILQCYLVDVFDIFISKVI